jgi:hypothetical protein
MEAAMETLGDDLIIGASDLAQFLFKDRAKRRKVYHLHERRLIPTFKIGPELAGRRSTLLRHFAEQERQSTQPK